MVNMIKWHLLHLYRIRYGDERDLNMMFSFCPLYLLPRKSYGMLSVTWDPGAGSSYIQLQRSDRGFPYPLIEIGPTNILLPAFKIENSFKQNLCYNCPYGRKGYCEFAYTELLIDNSNHAKVHWNGYVRS